MQELQVVEFFRLELQGVIQAFEVSQSYLGESSESFKDQGTDYLEAKNVLLGSFNVGLSTNGTIWFDMIKVNMTSHIYDHSEATSYTRYWPKLCYRV
jgi:hypothetical protein